MGEAEQYLVPTKPAKHETFERFPARQAHAGSMHRAAPCGTANNPAASDPGRRRSGRASPVRPPINLLRDTPTRIGRQDRVTQTGELGQPARRRRHVRRAFGKAAPPDPELCFPSGCPPGLPSRHDNSARTSATTSWYIPRWFIVAGVPRIMRQPGDAVHDPGTSRECGPHGRCVARVGRHADPLPGQRLDHRQHTVLFQLGRNRASTRTRSLAAHIDPVPRPPS
jgi:hypothetical protein